LNWNRVYCSVFEVFITMVRSMINWKGL
jgi:hypothetical protein